MDADHLDFGRPGLEHMTHTGGQRPAAQGNQDGVERWHGTRQFRPKGSVKTDGLRGYGCPTVPLTLV
jgi:hypothetical protein